MAAPTFSVLPVVAGYRAGRARNEREANERVHRSKTERGRLCRDRAGHLPCADHSLRDPNIPVSALQHSLRVDEGYAARRRLSFRVQVFVRLYALFTTGIASAVLRAYFPLRAATG